MELLNEEFFPLSSRCYDCCKEVFLPIFIAAVVRETYGFKQIKITEENFSKSCILCQLLRTKTLASGSKCIKHFFLFIPLLALYPLSGCDLFNMSCPS